MGEKTNAVLGWLAFGLLCTGIYLGLGGRWIAGVISAWQVDVFDNGRVAPILTTLLMLLPSSLVLVLIAKLIERKKKHTPTMTCFCTICKGIAGIVQLLPPAHPDSLSQRHTLSCTDFIGRERIVLEDKVGEIGNILNSGDVVALHAFRPLAAPFYCPDCRRVYCRKHWRVVPHYEDEFFDFSEGFCPRGHRRLIED